MVKNEQINMMKNTIAYMQKIFGAEMNVTKANKGVLDKLPLYINSTYDIWNAVIFDKEVLLLAKNTIEHLTPLQYQKHKEQTEKKTGALIVFILSDMKAYDRNRLTQKKINFIIEDKQVFIPQLLIGLKDYLPKTKIIIEALQPAAQLMILYHIQRKQLGGFTYKEIANMLDYSYLSISRAVENLVKLDLCETEGNKEKTLVFKATKKELWNKALPYMKPPIKKTLFINDELPKDLIFISDINALAFYSDLNNDKHKHYAINHTEFLKLEKEGFIKETSHYDGDYKIELWRYNPRTLTDTEYVDPLSLYITYKQSKDERIEMALEQIEDMIIW